MLAKSLLQRAQNMDTKNQESNQCVACSSQMRTSVKSWSDTCLSRSPTKIRKSLSGHSSRVLSRQMSPAPVMMHLQIVTMSFYHRPERQFLPKHRRTIFHTRQNLWKGDSHKECFTKTLSHRVFDKETFTKTLSQRVLHKESLSKSSSQRDFHKDCFMKTLSEKFSHEESFTRTLLHRISHKKHLQRVFHKKSLADHLPRSISHNAFSQYNAQGCLKSDDGMEAKSMSLVRSHVSSVCGHISVYLELG